MKLRWDGNRAMIGDVCVGYIVLPVNHFWRHVDADGYHSNSSDDWPTADAAKAAFEAALNAPRKQETD